MRGNLGYVGGKAKAAPWIASLLPYDPRGSYIEPFGGMGLVLFARRPCRVEVLNDLNERIINYHRACRDHNAEFVHLCKHTPHARQEFEWAREHLDDHSLTCPKRALAFAIAVEWSLMNGDGDNHGGFHVSLSWPAARKLNDRNAGRLPLIRDRLKNVSLENVDGVRLLERSAKVEDAVIYCDPPYTTADTSIYQHGAVDVLALTRALTAQEGRVAISGYGSEWDHLGWERHEKPTVRTVVKAGKPENTRATEVLWCNFNAATGRRL